MKAKFAIITIIFICCRFRKMLLVVIAEHNDFSLLCSHINVFILTWDCLHVDWKIPLSISIVAQRGQTVQNMKFCFKSD